jgi:hypothetical protein
MNLPPVLLPPLPLLPPLLPPVLPLLPLPKTTPATPAATNKRWPDQQNLERTSA